MPRIASLAYALPDERIGNAELATLLDVDAASIEARTGWTERRRAAEGDGPSALAEKACEVAFSEAQCGPRDVELIVFATSTPDTFFPGSGCYLQSRMDFDTVGALDLRAQCAGFLFALDAATAFVESGLHRRVLVAAGEVHTASLDWTPRGASVTPLFGDGAVAAVVEAGDGPGQVLASVTHTDPTNFEKFWCELPASGRYPLRIRPEDLATDRHHPQIDADFARESGVQQIVSAVNEVLAKSGRSADEVSRFVLHHVFRDAAAQAAETLGVSARSTLGEADVAHVASASLPIALCRARERGEVSAGDLVCLATAGSGACWGATLVQL